jgi:hypothetical protein
MIIPANGVQATRLLFMGERDKERYFRVRFIPVLPKQEDGFDLDANSVQKEQQQVSAGVNNIDRLWRHYFCDAKRESI